MGNETSVARCLKAARSTLVAGLTCVILAPPASALECPQPQPLARPGVLKETPAQMKATAELLRAGEPGQQVKAVLTDLQSRYPRAENAELANYLITAYCPVVSQQSGLSEADKKARMEQFVSQVMQAIY